MPQCLHQLAGPAPKRSPVNESAATGFMSEKDILGDR